MGQIFNLEGTAFDVKIEILDDTHCNLILANYYNMSWYACGTYVKTGNDVAITIEEYHCGDPSIPDSSGERVGKNNLSMHVTWTLNEDGTMTEIL